jgi:DNA-binding SARP family transcriptional activator/tetratricopeptide (TPR) repeat protein/TolB-like protein
LSQWQFSNFDARRIVAPLGIFSDMTEFGLNREQLNEIPSKDRISPESPAMELRLLGSFELFDRASGTAIAVPSRKAKALLAVLATAPRFTASRAHLAALLWSGSAEEQARQSLRQLLSNLRRAPQPFPVVYDDANVRLDETLVGVDVASLQNVATASISELTRAVLVYRGAFGLGLEIGEPDFDDWLRAERERVDNSVVPLMDCLVRELAHTGRHQDALTKAMALLALSPLREETHRLIIAQEAVVSGRASAMQRYEGFRILLRDELAVRPEPATIQLIEKLRNLPPSGVKDTAPNPSASKDAISDVARSPLAPVGLDGSAPPPRFWRHRPVAALLVLIGLVLSIAGGIVIWDTSEREPAAYVGESNGRLSIEVLPFDNSLTDDGSKALGDTLNRETRLTFSRNNQLFLIEPSDRPTRSLRARYMVRTHLSGTAGAVLADVTLIDSTSGGSIWSAQMPASNEPPTAFAREFYGYIFSEIALNQARVLSKANVDSVEAMFWRARASQLQTRIGTEQATAGELYKAILAKEPNHLFALLGLCDIFILRIAREKSLDRAADIAAASELLMRAKPQAPNSSDVAFKEGMLNKLQRKFEQASADFQRAMRLDPTHWNAAAQYAHVMIFLGRIEEGFALMEPAAKNLLPDLGAAETAYIAGETALAAGHADEGVRYLNMAINGNPTVGRIHALHAAALQLADRKDEAEAAAEQAQTFSPNYTPEVMAQRGGPHASPQYVEARTRMVEAFRAARDHIVSR